MKKYVLYLFLISVAITSLYYSFIATPTANGNEESFQESTFKQEEATSSFLVYISGAVKNPGVYAMTPPVTVMEAITAAGGVIPYAALDTLSLAENVEAGAHIHVPFQFQGDVQELLRPQKVPINTATVDELQQVKGIGEAMAKRIVQYRETHGAFQTLEDIKKVKGVGERTFERWRDSLCLL